MQYIFFFIMACMLVVITGCTRSNDDLAPWANCQNLNLKFGFDAYEECVDDEKWRLSEQVQSEEFKSMNKYREDQKTLSY